MNDPQSPVLTMNYCDLGTDSDFSLFYDGTQFVFTSPSNKDQEYRHPAQALECALLLLDQGRRLPFKALGRLAQETLASPQHLGVVPKPLTEAEAMDIWAASFHGIDPDGIERRINTMVERCHAALEGLESMEAVERLACWQRSMAVLKLSLVPQVSTLNNPRTLFAWSPETRTVLEQRWFDSSGPSDQAAAMLPDGLDRKRL